ncbi:very short patch repair endonuclease [Gordonia sp. N1V]|uniref:very short patch repair endonuclease n=1 Tax=Gordonia sp. N1V TaxID=3034163 RepID=UPI0023E2039A|nr:very short patch repair endonuclease [Gordonia sp. N1V]MDF3285483.1 very short patch repair endonuclease [Gordonia sp. N1V]
MAPTPSRGDGSPNASPATPYTTTAGRSRNMAAIKRANTKPEMALRRELHRRGLRYRKDFAIRLNGRLVRPDIAFTRRRLAVFVDGCFWHCCPHHGRQPAKNTDYWTPKLARNVVRDQTQTEALEIAGWTVCRLWEHEPVETMAQIVLDAIDALDNVRPGTVTQPIGLMRRT